MTGRYKFEDNEETVGKNRFFGNNAAKMYVPALLALQVALLFRLVQ